MNFFKKIFGKKKDEPIQNYEDFWKWFQSHSKKFYKVVETHNRIEEDFLDKISPKLEELKGGYFFLTGMKNDHTAELILTPDGDIKNIVFVEDLVAAAPKIDGWLFTALKPAHKLEDANISMSGYNFGSANISFYSNVHEDYPDEIDITIVHDDYKESNKSEIANGTYIFLDIFLGELAAVETIDLVSFIEKSEAKKELVPIEKLKDFLVWRQKEFVEKYEDLIHKNDEMCSILSAKLNNGLPLIASIHTDLLKWENKASHPWVASLEIKYDGDHFNGLPDDEVRPLLEEIEDEILKRLKPLDGYLYIGRQSADNTREIYFTCKDFRKPSKVFYEIEKKYSDRFEINYEIYKDKYWQSFKRFDAH